MMHNIDISEHFNARAATYDCERRLGAYNTWGNSYPAEELFTGRPILIDGAAFTLSKSERTGYDCIECCGQTIAISNSESQCGMQGLSFLCSGEMGDQELIAFAIAADGSQVQVRGTAKQWVVESAAGLDRDVVFSHLHYRGDYEATVLLPRLSCVVRRWETERSIVSIRLRPNPLCHVFAVTAI